jgi:thiol-disulfide isomerase/thioredoxin
MRFIHKVFLMLKPYFFILLIVGALQITGQLSTVLGYGQQAILATGVLNATDDVEAGEAFDFNFEAITPNGKPLDPKALQGKVVFLNLWATWCGPCRAEMPTIQKLYEENKDPNVVFAMLSLDRGATAQRKVQDYISKSGYTFPVYILNGQATGQLAVQIIPTTYVISKKGTVAKTETGMTNYNTDRFKKFLAKLAAE